MPEIIGIVLFVAVLVGVTGLAVVAWRAQRTIVSALAGPTGGGWPNAQPGPVRLQQFSDDWAQAIDMLSRRDTPTSHGVDWRLGGIYLMERLAQETPANLAMATGLLAAYVRQHAQPGTVSLLPTVEIQSVISALARGKRDGLDFRRTALWGVDLTGAEMPGANFSNARLRGGQLAGALLAGARFVGADLSDADLSQANLTDSVLTGARFDRTDFTGATLRGADLRHADLRLAILTNADLQDADLTGALLTGPPTAVVPGADALRAPPSAVPRSGILTRLMASP